MNTSANWLAWEHDYSPLGVAGYSLDGDELRCRYINRSEQRLSDRLSRFISSIEEPSAPSGESPMDMMRKAIASGEPDHRTFQLNGSAAGQWFEVWLIPIDHQHLLVFWRDALADRLVDSLTDRQVIDTLPNRFRSAIFVKLDGVDRVNGNFGYTAGKRLVRSISQSLAQIVSQWRGELLRGENSFLVLVPSVVGENEALTVLRSIQSTRESGARCNAFLGVAANEHIAAELYRRAELASGVAQSTDSDRRIVVWDDAIEQRVHRQYQIDALMSVPPEENEDAFSLVYQPIVNLKTGQIIGCEALLRVHPSWGHVHPLEAIQAAERLDCIAPVTNWVLRTAIKHLKIWTEFANCPVAINVPPWQLDDPSFASEFLSILLQNDIPPWMFAIEVTERGLYHCFQNFYSNLQHLRRYSLTIEQDDFGSGSSGFQILRKILFDNVKIDIDFVPESHDDRVNLAILKAMVALSQELGFGLIAEGVKSRQQAELLQEIGIFKGQGFFYSQPLAFPKFLALLKSGRSLPCDLPLG